MKLELNSPLDMHLHLRDGDMLRNVAPFSAKSFAAALIMPNLVPPITTIDGLLGYKQRIQEATRGEIFEPLMTLFFKTNYDYEFLEKGKGDIFAIKLYPDGATTNSQGGVGSFDIETLRGTLSAMEELQIPLCIHGESNGFVMDREAEFLPIYETIAKNFPKLKIIMEHITDSKSLELLEKYENLYATITLHHLLITLDDVAGGMLRPHLFCKPIAKRPKDRNALLKAALSANPKVMFGSDSAPHPVDKKEACGCAAGIFSAPIALARLAWLFEENGSLENLEKFVSLNAQKIYNFSPPAKKIVLEKEKMVVPQKIGDVVLFLAQEELLWRIRGED